MLKNCIESAEHIVLIIHKNPDADSLGSASAFYSYLLRLEKKITFFCATEVIQSNLAFIPWYDKITSKFPINADVAIGFDCANKQRLGVDNDIVMVNIDHHQTNDFFGNINLVDENAISTTQVVYDYFVANGIKMNAKMALALYAGLVDDTECFSSLNCTSSVFAMASDLINKGADHSSCIEWLYQRSSLASLRAKAHLFREMEIKLNGNMALFYLRNETLNNTGAKINDCKQVLNDALKMRTVKVAILYTELVNNVVKVSLRSDGSVNVGKIAEFFGGGGHKHRSGCHLYCNDMTFIDTMIEMIKKELE